MKPTFLLLALVAGALSACGNSNNAATSDTPPAATGTASADRTQGPVVSAAHSPGNPAIDTTPTTGETHQTPGASSFTESQARDALIHDGYTNVSALTQNTGGQWQGTATKQGHRRHVSIDFRGAISPQ